MLRQASRRVLTRVAAAATRPVSHLSSVVTDDLRAQYQRDGVVFVKGAFDKEWVAKLQAGAEHNLKHPGPLCDEHVQAGQPGRFHDDQFLWRRHDTFKHFIYDSPAAALAQAVTGSSAMHIVYDQLFVKEPGTKNETPWHTDHSYWHLAGGQVSTIWIALDKLSKSSVVKYVAGSHKWGLKHQIKSFSGEQDRYAASLDFPPLPDVDAMEKKGEVKVLAWDMEPGDVVVFDSYIVHGAPGNPSNTVRRRAYATRWANSEVQFDSRPGTMHYTWKERGGANLDCQLTHGQPLGGHLHPRIPVVM